MLKINKIDSNKMKTLKEFRKIILEIGQEAQKDWDVGDLSEGYRQGIKDSLKQIDNIKEEGLRLLKDLEIKKEKVSNKDDNFETGFYEGQIHFIKSFFNLENKNGKKV